MSIEQDARRYRWLRENLHRLTVDSYESLDGTVGMRSIVLTVAVLNWKAPAKPATVDEAIDKAMKKDDTEAFMKCFDSLPF